MDWFRHDADAHDDIKIRKLLRKHGPCAYGAFWLIVELIYRNDGSASAQDVNDEFDLMNLEGMKEILVDSGLFQIAEDGSWSSKRVTEEINYWNERRQKKVEAGRLGGQARASNAKATLSNAKAHPSTLPYPTKPVPDNTESSTYKNDSRFIGNTDDSCKLADTHKNASTPSGVPAGGSAVFLTLLSNRGEEVPVYESMVSLWEKTYPAVDVRAELQRMKSWCISNPTLRKTAQGMNRFCDNWLKKEQDRARIPQGSIETIKGTNIRMSLVADGTREEFPEPEVKWT